MRARYININEELVGTYEGMMASDIIEIWRNPPSVKEMGPWARAFTDYNGDFYIASIEDERRDDTSTTHTEMFGWLKSKGKDIRIHWDAGEGTYVDGISWQRYKNTNNFYLSESYDDIGDETIKYINDFMNKVEVFKPLGVKFKMEVIDNIDNNTFDQFDQYQQSQAYRY